MDNNTYLLKVPRDVNFKVTIAMIEFDFEIVNLRVENFREEENLKT